MEPQQTKTMPPVARRHEITIADWKPLSNKNSLKGVFTATMPSGMIFHSLMLLESNGKRWIGFPGKEWTDKQGAKQFNNFIEFTSRESADRFRDLVLAALDDHLAEGAE